MSAAAWLGLVVAGAASVAFSFWIYLRREVPVGGRRLLAGVRAAVLALLVLLLLDPTVPGRGPGARAPARWVALDASLSMAVAGPGEPSPWERAVTAARDLSDEEVQIVAFGAESPGEPSPAALLEGAPSLDGSRLAPLLERALESGASEVVVLSDLRLEDPVAVRALLGRGNLGVRFEDVGGAPANAGIARWELPASVGEGDPVRAEVALHASEAAQGRAATVEVREEDRLVQTTDVVLPAPGRLLPLSLELPPPEAGGEVRYQVRVRLDADVFPDDDVRTGFVERDPDEGLLVAVGLVPDWELRFLVPVLAQVTGLEGESYLRVGPDRWARTGEQASLVAEEVLRRRVEGAEILVVQGLGEDTPTWLRETLASKPRLLSLPDDEEGAALSGVAVGSPLGGEWYVGGEIPASALAADLGGAELQGLPPLTRLLPVSSDGQGEAPLLLQLRGAGPGEPALLLMAGTEGRRAVGLARGYWRWGFRTGPGRELYRRLWAGVAGWLLADQLAGGGDLVFPVSPVVPRGEDVRWSAPGSVGRQLSLALSRGDSVAFDTTFTVAANGSLSTPPLPPGSYTYRARTTDEEGEPVEGRLEVESYTDELLHAPARELSSVAANPAGVRRAGAGRPLRTHPVPYLLLLGLLIGEWIGRRRKGLR